MFDKNSVSDHVGIAMVCGAVRFPTIESRVFGRVIHLSLAQFSAGANTAVEQGTIAQRHWSHKPFHVLHDKPWCGLRVFIAEWVTSRHGPKNSAGE